MPVYFLSGGFPFSSAWNEPPPYRTPLLGKKYLVGAGRVKMELQLWRLAYPFAMRWVGIHS